MAHTHPKWLRGIIATAEVKLFGLFYTVFLGVWGVYMTSPDPKSIGHAIAFFVVWVLGLLVMHEANYVLWKKIIIAGIGFIFLSTFSCNLINKHSSEIQSASEAKRVESAAPIKKENDSGGIEAYIEKRTREISNIHAYNNVIVSDGEGSDAALIRTEGESEPSIDAGYNHVYSRNGGRASVMTYAQSESNK